MIKKVTLISFSTLSLFINLFAQNKNNIHEIYSAIIIYDLKPCIIAINKAINNNDVVNFNFESINEYLHNNRKGILVSPKLDSSWHSVLSQANSQKSELTAKEVMNLKVPGFAVLMVKTDSSIQLGSTGSRASSDTIAQPSIWIDSRISFSNILFFKRKAIVGFSRVSGLLDGEGVIYFLEKRKGRWQVVSRLNLWVS